MSKPWFLKMAMEAEPSPLAGLISNILKPLSSEKTFIPSKPLTNGKVDAALVQCDLGSLRIS